jgi:hypothetical protein
MKLALWDGMAICSCRQRGGEARAASIAAAERLDEHLATGRP